MLFLNCINKISTFGDDVFEFVFGSMNDLPGVIKGVIAIVFLSLSVIGILTLLKKSFKVFGIIISVIIIIILVAILFNK